MLEEMCQSVPLPVPSTAALRTLLLLNALNYSHLMAVWQRERAPTPENRQGRKADGSWHSLDWHCYEQSAVELFYSRSPLLYLMEGDQGFLGVCMFSLL